VRTPPPIRRFLSCSCHKQYPENSMLNCGAQNLRLGDKMIGKPGFLFPELGSAIWLLLMPPLMVKRMKLNAQTASSAKS
jgi:hypothetical protein